MADINELLISGNAPAERVLAIAKVRRQLTRYELPGGDGAARADRSTNEDGAAAAPTLASKLTDFGTCFVAVTTDRVVFVRRRAFQRDLTNAPAEGFGLAEIRESMIPHPRLQREVARFIFHDGSRVSFGFKNGAEATEFVTLHGQAVVDAGLRPALSLGRSS